MPGNNEIVITKSALGDLFTAVTVKETRVGDGWMEVSFMAMGHSADEAEQKLRATIERAREDGLVKPSSLPLQC